ncbi:uncharacterized protein EI90DRAFT_3130415 [Cantharellus anzutake]|uniref:uncharacterized protein n=1 Tax=Cantharellus anzutake TaxID=1750568 RepID=UPI001906AFB6|nr:uncharacterized protein EI90DRAFT_3130415 [Cantharellus anzutake]KAF8323548.1 hypothetical protein EI90DRAFT_3130415 [Cantharellus anzutake]
MVDAAQAIQAMFLALHEDTLSNDDYYYIIHECLLGIKRRILKVMPRSNQKYLDFVRNSIVFLDTWETIVPKISHARDFMEKDIKTDEQAHWVGNIDKNSIKKFFGAMPKFQPPAAIPRDPKDTPTNVKPVPKSPSPMDEDLKVMRDVKGKAWAHTDEDSALKKTSVSHRSSGQE